MTRTVTDCTGVVVGQSEASGVLVGFIGDSSQRQRKVQLVGHVEGQAEILLNVHQTKIHGLEAAVDHHWKREKG